MKHLIAVAALAIAGPAVAQEAPDVDAALAALDGAEVVATGQIGEISANSILFLRTDTATFPVAFALPREELARLDGCALSFMGDGNCAVSAKAEMEVDGNTVTLLVYELISLTRD